MMKARLRLLCFMLLLCVTISAQAQGDETVPVSSGMTTGLMAVLSVTPDTPETRANLEYVDYAAARNVAFAVNPDAAQDEMTMIRALPGFSPFTRVGLENFALFPQVNGFAFEDIHRAAYFGQPPADGAIFLGNFDADAIDAALTARGFMASSLFGFDGWCSAEGCDQGTRANIRGIVEGEAFDNGLGRKPPILLNVTDLFFARDLTTLEAMAAAQSGSGETLGAAADVQAMLRAIQMAAPETAGIRAAMLFNVEAVTGPNADEKLSLPTALLFIDWGDASGQTAAVVLAYDSAEQAQQTGEYVIAQMGTAVSAANGQPIQSLFEAAGATIGEPIVASEGGAAAVLIPLSYGLPEAGDYPYRLYYLLISMAAQRDLGWLAGS
ncbi:MAG: hypothetical protein U0670_15610 [Anaerolineae bacterium]